jgi:hypothetical protein
MLQILPRLLPNPLGTTTVVNSLAFIVLLTLLTTLYDRYHTVYRWRFSPDTVIVSSSYVEQ